MKRAKFFSFLFTAALMLLTFSAMAFAGDATPAPEDNSKAVITLVILVIAGILFVTEAVPLPITAMIVPVALAVTGVLTGREAFMEFGNDTVILFMAMFVVGESIFKTGFADKIGQFTVNVSRGSETKLLLMIVLVVGVMSAFLSNTGTVAVMIAYARRPAYSLKQ